MKYVKNRNLLAQDVEEIKEGGDNVLVKYKDKEVLFVIQPVLSGAELEEGRHVTIITFNTKESFDFLIKNWGNYAKNAKLKIIFVNPFSAMDKKWIINPHVHDKVCEKTGLRKGLLSLFSTVESISLEKIKEKVQASSSSSGL